MQNEELKLIKQQRILLYWNELGRHRVEPDACFEFMEYQFSVKRRTLLRIVKGSLPRNKTKLDHPDIDLITIEAFVKKLFNAAKKERYRKIHKCND